MHLATLALCILSAIWAIPYGIWEFNNNNKIGGVVAIFIAITCLVLAITNFWIE